MSHKKRIRRRKSVRHSGALIVALSLAHEMADSVGAVGDDRDDLVAAALAAGEWLAMVDRPGRWDTLDVAAILPLLPSDDPREHGRFLLSLTGLVGYAGLAGYLEAGVAASTLGQIQEISDDAIIQNFAKTTARTLRPSRAA